MLLVLDHDSDLTRVRYLRRNILTNKLFYSFCCLLMKSQKCTIGNELYHTFSYCGERDQLLKYFMGDIALIENSCLQLIIAVIL